MENHSLVGDAVQMMGDAADFVVQKAAPAVLGAVLGVSAAHADTMKAVPVASQVAPIKVEVTKATLQELNIDPRRLEQFNKLSAPRQGLVLFFLDGLKKAKLAETATLKTGAEKLVFLFTNHEINETSRDAMKKQAGALERVRDVDSLIAELSDPKTYGIALTSPDSPYGQRFSQVKQEMRDTYAEAYKLHSVAKNMESPELVAINKKRDETRREAARLQEEATQLHNTNAALGRVISSFR